MKSRTFICLMFFLVMSLPIYSQNMKVTVVDKDGNEISPATVGTILRPSKDEKRPKSHRRIDLDKII